MRPQEFFIGIRDFFAIMVPGSTFLLLLSRETWAALPASPSAILIFGAAIAAYLAGSVAAALGALLDLAVDPTLQSGRFRRSFGGKLARREALADQLRARLLRGASYPVSGEDHPESIKSFWWSYLRLNCATALAELDRIEANSKLFRSLVAVFAIHAAIYSQMDRGEQANFIGAGPGELALAALVSAGLYAGNRYVFLGALYRLAAAYGVPAGDAGPLRKPRG